jgi:hypothetical protein
MYRLTLNGVTYVFRSNPDFELARSIARRLEPTRDRFERELTNRWVSFDVEKEPTP